MKIRMFHIFATAAVGLIVAGFLVPPTGKIDPSVFTGVGELFAFAALDKLPEVMRKGGSVKVSKGDTSIEASTHKRVVREEAGDE